MRAGNQDSINFVGAHASISANTTNFRNFMCIYKIKKKTKNKNKTKTYGLAIRLNCNSALSLHSFGTIFSALRKLAAEKWTWYTPSFLFIFLLFIKISLMMIYILDVYGDRTLS